jgi:hypothetical protein
MVELIVEVVAAAVIAGRHDQIVAFFAYHDPDNASAGLEHVFFDAAFAQSFQCFVDSLTKP